MASHFAVAASHSAGPPNLFLFTHESQQSSFCWLWTVGQDGRFGRCNRILPRITHFLFSWLLRSFLFTHEPRQSSLDLLSTVGPVWRIWKIQFHPTAKHSLCPPGHLDHPNSLMNLANGLVTRPTSHTLLSQPAARNTNELHQGALPLPIWPTWFWG